MNRHHNLDTVSNPARKTESYTSVLSWLGPFQATGGKALPSILPGTGHEAAGIGYDLLFPIKHK